LVSPAKAQKVFLFSRMNMKQAQLLKIYSLIKDSMDAAVDYEHGKVIKYDFKPGSVEKSTNLYEMCLQSLNSV
jgi:hypothetical protein